MLKTTNYKVTRDGVVVAEGSKKRMHKERNEKGGTVWFSPDSKIGDTLK